MKVKYQVHSCTEEKFPMTVTVGSRQVEALVPGLVVELVDGDQHGHTFRFMPDADEDLAAHKELFAPGSTVVASFDRE